MTKLLPAFESFVHRLRAIWAAERDDRTRMKHAKPLLERFVMDPTIRAHSADWPSTEARKNLRLYVDPEYGFVINAVVRAPGRRGSVHDHADAWVLYGVLDGQESLERYDRIDDGSTPGQAELRLSCVTTGTQGKVDLVAPPRSMPSKAGLCVGRDHRAQQAPWRGNGAAERLRSRDQDRRRALRPDADPV